jgi:hypothetical protein
MIRKRIPTERPAVPSQTVRGLLWQRRGTVAVVTAVAGIAFFISYRHAYQLVITHGEDYTSAWAVPLTVDGLIFSASMVLLRASRHGIKPPKAAWFAMALGVAATLFANVSHGVPYGTTGILTSAWPAVAMVVSFEMLFRMFRPVQASQDVAETPVHVAPVLVPTSAPAAVQAPSQPQAAPRKRVPNGTPAQHSNGRPLVHPRWDEAIQVATAYHVSNGNWPSQRVLAGLMNPKMRSRELAKSVIAHLKNAGSLNHATNAAGNGTANPTAPTP